MKSLDLDLDLKMTSLEHEWRQVYEASMIARAEYQALAADRTTKAKLLDDAREQLDRSEALKSRIMAKIERLEDALIGRD